MPPKKAASGGSASTRKRRKVAGEASRKSATGGEKVLVSEPDCEVEPVQDASVHVKQEPSNSGPVLDAKTMNSFHSFLQKCKASPNAERRKWYASYKSCETVDKKREWMSKWRLDKSCGFCQTAELSSSSVTTINTYDEGWYTKFEVSKELGIPIDGPEMEALTSDCAQQPHEVECWKEPYTCQFCIPNVVRHMYYVYTVCRSK